MYKLMSLSLLVILLSACDPIAVKVYEFQYIAGNQNTQHCIRQNKIIQAANDYLQKEGYLLKWDSTITTKLNHSSITYFKYRFYPQTTQTKLPFSPTFTAVYLSDQCQFYIYYGKWAYSFNEKEKEILNQLNNGMALEIKKQLGIAILVQTIAQLPEEIRYE